MPLACLPLQLSTVNCQLSVFSSLNNTKGASRPHNLSFTKNSHLIEVRVRLVDQPGFEPRQTVPKTVVLPLHHWSSSFDTIIYKFHLNLISLEYSLEGTDVEAETPILWPPDAKN